MRLRRGTLFVASALALGPSFLASPLCAQADATERAFTIANTNDLILRIDFGTKQATVVNSNADQQARGKLEALVALPNRQNNVDLIVTDNEAGEVLFYHNALGTNIPSTLISTALPRPGAFAVDNARNIYIVNSALGTSSARKRQVWIIPNGGTAKRVDEPPSDSLAEVEFINFPTGAPASGPQQGDLLVLSELNPQKVYLYRNADDCARSQSCTSLAPVDFIPSFPSGVTPTSMAISSGFLLIGTAQGQVRKYNIHDGSFEGTLPLSGLGSARLEIAVGVQDTCEVLLVVSAALKNVKRFDLTACSTPGPNPDVVTQGIEKAQTGVALASAGVPTLASCDPETNPDCTSTEVIVRPEENLTSRLERVDMSGTTTARVIELKDPRCDLYDPVPTYTECRQVASTVDAASCGSQTLETDELCLSDLDPTLPNIIIPAYTLAFRKSDPVNGDPTFVLHVMDSTASWSDIAELEIHEEDALDLEPGDEPECSTGPHNFQARLSFAPETLSSGSDKEEPPIVEGDRFIDVSSGCGSHKGNSWSFSLFLTGRDVREVGGGTFNAATGFIDDGAVMGGPGGPPGIIGDKLNNLRRAVDAFADSGCIPNDDPAEEADTLQQLNEALDNAILPFDGGDCFTFCAITDFNEVATNGDFGACSTEVRGELRARANSILFMLDNLGANASCLPCWSE